jgi:hypothetical protein
MRTLVTLLGLLFIAGLVVLSGCESGEAPAKTAGGETSEGEGTGEAGEGEFEEEVDDGPIPFDRLWPDHPKARKILVDPNDMSQNMSYWRDTKVGDWVRFLNHRQNVIIFELLERKDGKLKFSSKEYKRTGEEIPEKELDVRDVDIVKNDDIVRGPLLRNPLVVRTVYEWKLFKSDKVLYCERHNVDNPRGDNKETCWSREVRCHGVVFQRSGNNLVVVLIDYGDIDNFPKWDHLKPDELLSYWHKMNRFLDERIVAQEDPEEGEQPEMPEDPPGEKLTKDLKRLEELVGKELSDIIDAGVGDKIEAALNSVGQIIEDVGSYARANNFTPAVAQAKDVTAELGRLKDAAVGGDKDQAVKALGKLCKQLDWLYISVNYKKGLK